MKLEWSVFAITDREQIFDYIEADNPHAAIVVDDHIEEQVEKLIQFPMCGRVGRIPGTRELVIPGTPYIVAYRIEDEAIHILRVLHGALRWPEEVT